jgi:cyclophilin family peptidyl-prolyl cis-trans isomerase
MLQAVLLALLAVQVPAQADDAANPAPAAERTWATVSAEIERIENRLTALQTEFQAAQNKPEEQAKLREEALGLVEQIKQQFRLLGKVVPTAFAAEAAKPEEAGQRAKSYTQQSMGLAFQENRYWDALAIAEAMLRVNPQDDAALNVAGISHFATHNFQKAIELLQQAKAANLLIPDLPGGHYLETAKPYVEYWTAEQAIREKEAALTGDQQLPRVLMKTTKGDILLELFEDQAPNTVANFISLVEKGYYNGSPYHRVIPGFMAQGGTPGEKFGGLDGPGYTIECECYRPDKRRHFAGSLSMAHAGKNTGGSQYFITHLPTAHLDGPDSFHTVFGRVVKGMETVAAIEQGDKIVTAEVVRKRNHPYQPTTKPDRGQ